MSPVATPARQNAGWRCAPRHRLPISAERGQASTEWVALVLLCSLLFTALLAGLGPLPLGALLARDLGAKLICAVELSDSCRRDPELVAAYGSDLAAQLRSHAPWLAYESGMRALPVDFRTCRSPSCGDGRDEGTVWRSRSGEPVTAFVHVVDCRAAGERQPGGAIPPGCSGSRVGNLYLQYWLYYADSATLRGVPVAGRRGYHHDDWESYQVRIGSDGAADARASSHQGYNYAQSAMDWGSDAGIGPLRDAFEFVGLRDRGGWGPETGAVFISGGSHAGSAKASPGDRFTPPRRITLVPLETLGTAALLSAFAISPPWQKAVWRDPEANDTR